MTDAPGAPAVALAAGWSAGGADDDILTGPLPALQRLAGRFGAALSAAERLAFLRATVTRGQRLADDDLAWLLDYAEGRVNRDQAVLAALEGFCTGMAGAVTGNGDPS